MNLPVQIHFFPLIFAGGGNRQRPAASEPRPAENEIVKAHLQGRRLRLTDDEYRKLKGKSKALGGESRSELACTVTLENTTGVTSAIDRCEPDFSSANSVTPAVGGRSSHADLAAKTVRC